MKSFEELLDGAKFQGASEITDLSPAEKQRIYNAVMKTKKERGGFHMKRKVLVLAAAILSVGIVAGAATVFVMNDGLKRYFQADETVAVSGENPNITAKKDGVSITAVQVIGDDFGAYVLFDAEGKDFSDKQFGSVTASAEGIDTLQCSDMKFMGSENQNHSSFVLHVSSPKPLWGRKIRFTFENITAPDEKTGGYSVVQKGKWNVSWKTKYVPNGKTTVAVGKEIEVYEGKAVWDSLDITSLSATVHLSGLKNTKVHTNNANNTLAVAFKDGTILRSDYNNADDVLDDTTTISLFFGKIAKVSDIQSVTFAGVTVSLGNSEDIRPRKLFIDLKNRFTLDMSQKLYDMTKVSYADGHDSDLNADVSKVIFSANQKPLFEIKIYKGTFSASDADEKKPLETYICSKEGYTYTLNVAEPETEEDIKLYAEIVNDEISKIDGHFNIMK